MHYWVWEFRKGTRLQLLLLIGFWHIGVYCAIVKIKAVVVPFSILLRAKALKTLIHDSDSVMVITSSNFVETIEKENVTHVMME
jgi:acyl-CoA synthetase (AMP-forming)/AMP-acid ligase II